MGTHDEYDYKLLSMANEKDKFGLDIQGIDDHELQLAFERGIDADWFTLVDVSYIAAYPEELSKQTIEVLMRVFKLTAAGKHRLNQLRGEGHV